MTHYYTPPTASQTSAMFNEAAEHLEKAREIILKLYEAAPLDSREDTALALSNGHTRNAEATLKAAGQHARARFEREAASEADAQSQEAAAKDAGEWTARTQERTRYTPDALDE